jgi:subtilisin family serine protease
VAALMAGQSSRFHGVLAHATLYSADIYCDSATGGSADKIAAALAWFAREDIGVINISLVGPANRALERIVKAMLARGHILVAAVGNDGPAAAPLYPASYLGVVGVSAVDGKGRGLPEAARGPQVMFAAPGSNMVSAAIGTPPYRQVRGTSFAAPIVAALLADLHPRADKAEAQSALAALTRQASKADKNVTDNTTGLGIVGAVFRTDPRDFR